MAKAELYQHAKGDTGVFNNQSVISLKPGEKKTHFGNLDGEISMVDVPAGTVLILYSGYRGSGQSLRIEGPKQSYGLWNDGWNDKANSAELKKVSSGGSTGGGSGIGVPGTFSGGSFSLAGLGEQQKQMLAVGGMLLGALLLVGMISD